MANPTCTCFLFIHMLVSILNPMGVLHLEDASDNDSNNSKHYLFRFLIDVSWIIHHPITTWFPNQFASPRNKSNFGRTSRDGPHPRLTPRSPTSFNVKSLTRFHAISGGYKYTSCGMSLEVSSYFMSRKIFLFLAKRAHVTSFDFWNKEIASNLWRVKRSNLQMDCVSKYVSPLFTTTLYDVRNRDFFLIHLAEDACCLFCEFAGTF